ncbi:MAG: flavin monoamine oxidase family protein [Oceanicaulis sp.]
MKITRRQALAWTAGAGAFAVSGCGPRADRAGKDADVIIAGAGLSGLHAALMLQEAGLDVLVLEASHRIGGRMVTLDHLPGAPEAGGQQIGATYARIRTRAGEAGLAFEDFPPNRFGEVLSVRGELIAARDWAGSPANRLPEAWRAMAPQALLFMLAARNNPFRDVYAWRDPEADAHDVAARDWLTAQGANAEALRLIEISLNGTDLDTYSMLNLYRSLAIYAQERDLGGSQALAAGSQRLPEAMATRLTREVRLNAPVLGFEADGAGALVRLETGEELRADFAISSLPFTVLRHLAVDAPVSRDQRLAIDTLAYTPIVQLHLEALEPFWEADGLAPEMWTDTDVERVFAGRGAGGAPTGMLTVWLDGFGALNADQMPDDALEAMALDTLARLRPASAGKLRLAHVQRWAASNRRAGGAYMHWRPGEARRFAGTMAEPAGRLHFAGEHTGDLHTGMEAAMESGERAALEILERAGA